MARIYTIKEMVEKGLKKENLMKAIHEGKLSAKKVGREYYISDLDIAGWNPEVYVQKGFFSEAVQSYRSLKKAGLVTD